MIRSIAVCDDELLCQRQICDCLSQIERGIDDRFQIYYYSSGEDLLRDAPQDLDILLLDIGLNCSNGIDVAKQLRQAGSNVIIIFITSLTEYALQGYEVHAFSFLPKPVQVSDLRRHLLEAFAQLDKQRCSNIVIDDGFGTQVVDVTQLVYAEVLQHQTKLVLTQSSQTYKMPLSTLEEKVKGRHFFRCHKSFLVNMAHIVRIDTSTIGTSNGDTIPLSKYRRKEFLTAYSRYLGDTL